jgi:transcriptional regulator with XRE-family HTH domain
MDKEVLLTVGRTIRRLRERTGLTQEEFAQAADLDRSFYGRVERGSQNIALITLCIVAANLKVHPSELLGDIGELDCSGLRRSRRRRLPTLRP